MGIRRIRRRRGASGTATFTPLRVPNLALWLDGADATTLLASVGGVTVAEFGKIAQWLDKSGNERHVSQDAEASRGEWDTLQICGRPGIRLSGAQGYSGAGLTASAITAFAVWQSDDSSSGTVYELSSNVGTLAGLYLSNAIDSTIYARNTGGASAKNVSPSSWAKLKGPMRTLHVHDGTHAGHTLHDKGSALTLATYAALSANPGVVAWGPSGIHIGQRFDGTGRGPLVISEIVVYAGILSATDTARVEAYLDAKWNLPRTGAAYAHNILCVGDSKTLGLPGNVAHSYPTQLQQMLGSKAVVTNLGIGSYRLADSQTDAPTTVDPLYNPSAASNIIIEALGGNDIGLGSGISGPTLWANKKTWLRARRAVGWSVLTVLIGARQWTSTYATREQSRIDYNALALAEWAAEANGIEQLDMDPKLGPDGVQSDLVWFTDGVHETYRGYVRRANRAFLALQALI